VHDDRVAGPGVAEKLVQALTVDGGAGLLVGPGPLGGDARSRQGVELAVQALFAGGDTGVAEGKALVRLPGTGFYVPSVP
jgi:hypothetical protein